MDIHKVEYRARMQVAEAMADPRAADILSEMLRRAPWLFRQSVNTAYLAAQVLIEKSNQPGSGQWDDLRDILDGALLHDAGMLLLPDEILNGAGELSDKDREAMRSHCEAGRRMLSGRGYPETVCRIAWQHHERTGGSGYPEGAEPGYYGTRLVAVCDVYAAMTSERSYRRAFNIYEAGEIMAGMPLSQGCLMDLKQCPDI